MMTLAQAGHLAYPARMDTQHRQQTRHATVMIRSAGVLMMIASSALRANCPASIAATPPPGLDRTLTLTLNGLENHPVYGDKKAYIHVPASYQPGQAPPLVVLLHGAAGNPSAAAGQASVLRGVWRAASDAGGFLVISPVGSGASGSWIAPADRNDVPSDYDVIQAAIQRMSADYTIDPNRIYLWGFSAGGHVALDIALNEIHATVNSSVFAAFAVNAGVSRGLACAGASTTQCLQNFSGGASKRPISVHIGNTDGLLAFAVDDRARFNSLGWQEGVTFFWHEFDGGHYVYNDQPLQIWNNLCRFSARAAGMPGSAAMPQPITVESGTIGAGDRTSSMDDPGLRPQDRKR